MRARWIAILVVCASCAGALGQVGRRAPPGVAFCEPSAVRVETLDGGGVARTVTARCEVGGVVSIDDSGGFDHRMAPDDAAALWRVFEDAAPLASCAPSAAPTFRITIVGDDGDDVASCPLGGDARFDAILAAVMGVRHPAHDRWIDFPAVAIAVAPAPEPAPEPPVPEPAIPELIDGRVHVGVELQLSTRRDFGLAEQIELRCDNEPPLLWSDQEDHGPVRAGVVDARACRAAWAGAALAVATARCDVNPERAARRTCLTMRDRGGDVQDTCCVPGTNPQFDLAVRDVAVLVLRTPHTTALRVSGRR